MTEKRSEERKMRELIAAVAGPVQFSDNRKSWLSRAARNSGLTFRTVKALFYGEINDPDHLAARRLKDVAALVEGQGMARSLAEKFETIAGGLNAADADFHSNHVAALLDAAGRLRDVDRTGT